MTTSADDPTRVNLGGREYKLEPQRVGRIAKQLRTLGEVFGGDTQPDEVTGVVHDALKVFIPDLAGEWELAGYPSAEAYAEVLRHRKAELDALEAVEKRVQALLDEHGVDNVIDLPDDVDPPEFVDPEPDWQDPYDEKVDRSPTVPDIGDAIEAIYAINGGKRLERLLGKVIDPAVIKVLGRQLIVGWATRMSQQALAGSGSTASPSSPPPNGASPSQPSGTLAATPELSPADPSPSSPLA